MPIDKSMGSDSQGGTVIGRLYLSIPQVLTMTVLQTISLFGVIIDTTLVSPRTRAREHDPGLAKEGNDSNFCTDAIICLEIDGRWRIILNTAETKPRENFVQIEHTVLITIRC